jgi:hypothetical protein
MGVFLGDEKKPVGLMVPGGRSVGHGVIRGSASTDEH